jgi:hypothetical protein
MLAVLLTTAGSGPAHGSVGSASPPAAAAAAGKGPTKQTRLNIPKWQPNLSTQSTPAAAAAQAGEVGRQLAGSMLSRSG